VPDPIARFERGILLHAALVHNKDRDGDPDHGALFVNLWWSTTDRLTEPYTVFVHYLRDGERVVQDDAQPGYGYLPTTSWWPGDLIMDEHVLPGLEASVAIVPNPARDTLRIGLYNADTLEGLSLLDSSGNPVGDWLDWPVILSE
jgi:hypothetical protein